MLASAEFQTAAPAQEASGAAPCGLHEGGVAPLAEVEVPVVQRAQPVREHLLLAVPLGDVRIQMAHLQHQCHCNNISYGNTKAPELWIDMFVCDQPSTALLRSPASGGRPGAISDHRQSNQGTSAVVCCSWLAITARFKGFSITSWKRPSSQCLHWHAGPLWTWMRHLADASLTMAYSKCPIEQ